jgi:hypothetical protein
MAARIVVSGVRSSCEALATNRRWALKAEPLVQAVLGDALGRGSHLPDRPQRPPGH